MSIVRSIAALCAIVMLTACAGTSPTSSSSYTEPAAVTPSSSSIQEAINMLTSGLISAINGTNGQSQKRSLTASSLTDRAFFVAPRSITTCNPNTGVCQVNEQFQQRENCVGGGYSSSTGGLTGSINANGGTLNFTGYQSLVDCSSGGWVMNSTPYLSSGGTFRIFGERMTINLTLGGGFVMSNAPGRPNGRTECHFSGVIFMWDTLTNWSNSGSVLCSPGGFEFRF